MSEENYTARVECGNCNFEGHVSIDKGEFVTNTKCPNCDTKSLKKMEPRNNFKKGISPMDSCK